VIAEVIRVSMPLAELATILGVVGLVAFVAGGVVGRWSK
jgi:hypothetical protein